MTTAERTEQSNTNQRSRYFGRCYYYNTPGDGRVKIGVVRGLGDIWIVGFIAGTGGCRRVKTKRLEPTTHPAELQILLDQWAHERQLEEVKDV